MKFSIMFLCVGILCSYTAHAMRARSCVGLLALSALSAEGGMAKAAVVPVQEPLVSVVSDDRVANRTRVFDACKIVVSVCQNGTPSEDQALEILRKAIDDSERNVDEKDSEGRSGLYILGEYFGVVGSNKCEALPYAVNKLVGADADALAPRYGIVSGVPMNNSLLHRAVEFGHIPLILILINNGSVDVDDINALGMTPFAQGANVSAHNWAGLTALDLTRPIFSNCRDPQRNAVVMRLLNGTLRETPLLPPCF